MKVKLVMEVRKLTGLPILECKKALEAVDGDIDKAVVWLRERHTNVADMQFRPPQDHYLVDKNGVHITATFRPNPPGVRGVDTWQIRITEFDFERLGIRKVS